MYVFREGSSYKLTSARFEAPHFLADNNSWIVKGKTKNCEAGAQDIEPPGF